MSSLVSWGVTGDRPQSSLGTMVPSSLARLFPGTNPNGKTVTFFFCFQSRAQELGANESTQGGTLSKQPTVAPSFPSWERMQWGQQQTEV